jgi:hypothetical protein
MPDDDTEEMIRTAIFLHLDEETRVQALQWLDERLSVYEACKDLEFI